MSYIKILPAGLVEDVEQYVDGELQSVEESDNRSPLDDSGVYSLHMLAAQIYAAGWADGERAQSARDRGARRRLREAVSGE